MDSLEARIREIIREELAALNTVQPSADETMTSAMAASESGYSTASVSAWCQQGLIRDAKQNCRGGRWKFTRKAWLDFRARFKRRALSRLKAA